MWIDESDKDDKCPKCHTKRSKLIGLNVKPHPWPVVYYKGETDVFYCLIHHLGSKYQPKEQNEVKKC